MHWIYQKEEKTLYDSNTGTPYKKASHWIYDQDQILVAVVNGTTAEVEGRAKLIAAAPFMLEFIKTIADSDMELSEAAKNALESING